MSADEERGQPSGEDWQAAAQAGAERLHLAGTDASLHAVLPAALLQQIIDAARDDVPHETVGLLVARAYAAAGGVPERYVRMRNAAESPYRYLMDPDEQLQVILAIDDADEVVWGIVHSHVASAAVPSTTDVGLAFYPDSLYLVCSLAGEMPEVRAWTIRDGEVTEAPLAVG
ncbi:MAG TPA: M67 family metallopeptidase [Candidatus Limnocylindria bacterium]|nr:M67 family metallopeptidase [Candidatus Limnocylindria bacterium]